MSEQDPLHACVGLDRQIASLYAEVSNVYAAIAELKTRRNTFTSIARLPPEILSKIFESIISLDQTESSSGRLEWMHLMEVCRHWRSVMIENPRLWSSLAFCSVELTSKMLLRSKASPLEIRAGSLEMVLDAVALALSHISRIRVLHLRVWKHIEMFLPAIGQPAPLLKSLRLENLDGPSNSPIIPSLLFAPCLRHFASSNLTVQWDSPHLAGLTHLEIRGSARLPSLGELRDVLSHCTALDTLILSDSLPHTEDQQNQSQDPIPLPTLAHLHLVGSVTDCDIVVRTISFPPTTTVVLHCDIGMDISLEVPHLLSGLGARRDGDFPIGRLGITMPRGTEITFKAWTSTNDDTMEHPFLELTFEGALPSDENLCVNLVHTTCQGLSPTEILNLNIDVSLRVGRKRSWRTMLGSLKNLQVLTAGNRDVKGLLFALTPEPINDAEKSRHWDVFLPRLRDLTLHGASFWSSDQFEALQDCLMQRWENHAEIQKLLIFRCFDIYEPDIIKLKEIVVEMECLGTVENDW
jgi:hypothetical protein